MKSIRPACSSGHRRTGAAERNVGDVGLEDVVEQHAAEMRRRSRARRAELHLGLVGLRVAHELLEVLRRKILADGQQDRHLGEQRNRREVGLRIVERPLVERLALGMGADCADAERVAVRLGVGHALGAGHAAGAADVLDHHLLAEQFAHPRADDAAEHVGRAARRKRDDHVDRAGRVVLRRRARGQCHKAREGGAHQFQSCAHSHWRVSLWFICRVGRTHAIEAPQRQAALHCRHCRIAARSHKLTP